LERELGRPVRVPEQPQAVGALGAAVQGRREALAA
ncbi:MAG: 2-hydroxyglutaryl-CoA dehydratase, partial [Proteobacteria bacterium]|nr:2-hydroxyglutaryl-CoA dehydratase [Pseudomonadota bacterium]